MSCGGTPRLPAIVVFARLPVEGMVKTRLAATIGNGKAVRVYQLCAEHVMMQGTRCHDTRCTVYCSDSRDQDAVCAWLSLLKLDIPVKNQISVSNLGERIYHALHSELEKGAPKVLIVGTDVPDLSRDILHQALQALDSNDMVLGPAMDGGYYLLGLKRLEPELFHNIEWSTPTVLASQVANAERLGYSLAALDTLPRLRDIDVVQDLQEWCTNGDAGHPLKQPLQAVLADVPL